MEAESQKSPRAFMPFHPRFKDAVQDGAKTATARRRRYALKGEALITPFGPIVLVDVVELPLVVIASKYWREEGMRSPREFVDTWNELFPEAQFVPSEVVWLHRFRLAYPGEVGGLTHV